MNRHSTRVVISRTIALAGALLLASLPPVTGQASTGTQTSAVAAPAVSAVVKMFSVPGLEEPFVATGATTAAEDEALHALLAQYQRQSPTPDSPRDLAAFERFLQD